MYKLQIILRYLRRRIMPLIAMLAVMLCTAMVLIVLSIMGGFLNMMTGALQRLEADVTVEADITGFPHYEALLADFQKLPEVAAASPVIRSFGLVSLPGETQRATYPVEILGVDPASLNQVVPFESTLFWHASNIRQWVDLLQPFADQEAPNDPQRLRYHTLKGWLDQGSFRQLTMALLGSDMPKPAPAIVMGIEVNPQNIRDVYGHYDILNNRTIGSPVTLTVLPISEHGMPQDPEAREVTVVNDFKSGLYEIDRNRVFVPFKLLQSMLKMTAAPQINMDTGKPTGRTIAARASMILVKGKAGVPLEQLHEAVRHSVRRAIADYPDLNGRLSVSTWRERHEKFLNAVANERNLVTFLFAVISLVAFVMIALVFYMIVLEKTRDIGVLRALGAGQLGIAGIFLGYGLIIGILGALLGLAVALAIVTNINQIQTFLATHLGVTTFYVGLELALGVPVAAVEAVVWWRLKRRYPDGRPGVWAAWMAGVLAVVGLIGLAGGFWYLHDHTSLATWLDATISWEMWRPDVYYLDRIPSQVAPVDIAWVVPLSIVCSVLGSLIPAIMAARLNPVEALRYE